MKKILLPIILLITAFNVANAQTDFCKDITRTTKGSKVIYESPTPGDKRELVTQCGFIKAIDENGAQNYFKLGTAMGGNPDVTDVVFTFEDGSELKYSNIKITQGEKSALGDYMYTTIFAISKDDIVKFKSNPVRFYMFLGKKRAVGFKGDIAKLRAYADCIDNLNEAPKPLINANEKKSIDGFWGIKFGASVDEVKTAIAAKGGTYSTGSSKPDNLMFSGASFTGRNTEYINVRTVNDKFYEASVGFPELTDVQLIPTFNTIVSELSAVYGDAKIEKTFKEPYKEGDGLEAGAIRIGMASYVARWKTNNGNTIIVQINKNSTITIFYTDTALNKVKNTQKSADY
ncbi:MAG: hypothetical protein ABIN91_06785 [Mucilaginibacter sp.]|uniref:hypothetical protein n=1 Tax=Mucilaginibacter sp. TaxID=1882438 RepID=UPI0032647F2A